MAKLLLVYFLFCTFLYVEELMVLFSSLYNMQEVCNEVNMQPDWTEYLEVSRVFPVTQKSGCNVSIIQGPVVSVSPLHLTMFTSFLYSSSSISKKWFGRISLNYWGVLCSNIKCSFSLNFGGVLLLEVPGVFKERLYVVLRDMV